MKKLFLKKQQGFSLVEMLVSISILLLVVTGPMTVTSRTAKSATFATEQVQAFFLAQEGLELAQKSRDDLLLKNFLPIADINYISNPWHRFTDTGGIYSSCYNGSAGCGLEWDGANANGNLLSPVDCSSLDRCRLFLKSAPDRSLYTYSSTGNNIMPYTRKITFTETTDGKGVKVISTVTWRTGSLVAEQKVEVETYLYNIYDKS